MQDIRVSAHRTTKAEELREQIYYQIESSGATAINLLPHHMYLMPNLKDYIHRTMINQGSYPLENLHEQADEIRWYISKNWRDVIKTGANSDAYWRFDARRGLNQIAQETDLGHFVKVMADERACTEWMYALVYGVGRFKFYRNDKGLIVANTNDLGVFEEFVFPGSENQYYSARILFEGFEEYSQEFENLKAKIIRGLGDKKKRSLFD